MTLIKIREQSDLVPVEIFKLDAPVLLIRKCIKTGMKSKLCSFTSQKPISLAQLRDADRQQGQELLSAKPIFMYTPGR